MKELSEIITSILPIVLLAVLNSSLATVSVQGLKGFLKIELDGNKARAVTVAAAIFWSWATVIYFGGGTVIDATLVCSMTFLGATGIYEVLMQKKADVEK